MQPLQTTRTILLVEDEAIVALAQQATLERSGFSVIRASSGERAVQTVAERPNIDLILMDIDLGAGIDGTEAAVQILEMRDVPIVFLTSHSEKEMVDRVKHITRYGYVLKSSGEFVLIEATTMAFELFEAHRQAAASSDHYQSVVRLSGEIVIRYDTDNRCIFGNERAAEFYGTSMAELLRTDYLSFVHPDDQEATRTSVDQMKRSRHTVAGFVNREATPGGWRIVEWNSAPIVDTSGTLTGYQATGRDVTEREQSKRDLQVMGTALETATNGVVVADFAGTITHANTAIRVMWGYSDPQEVVGRSIFEFVSDPEDVKRMFDEAIHGGRTSGEFVAKRADGTTFDAELTTTHITTREGLRPRIMGSVVDVSRRKATEGLLSVYQQAADSAEDMIVAVDHSGRYMFANRSFLEQHELKPREVIGRTAWDVLGSDIVEDVLREKVDACLRGEVVTFETSRRVGSQGARWMKISYSPIRMDDAVIGALGILKDITEYKQIQTRLAEQLARSERLREIARETLTGAPAREILTRTVRQLGYRFPELRVAYSTLDQDLVLSVVVSVQPQTMPDLTGTRADLSAIPEYAQALRDGEPAVVPDVRLRDDLAPLRETLEAGGTRALLDMPIVGSGRLVGLLCFDSPVPRGWTHHEQETLHEIAHYLTLALEARVNQQDLETKTREWETLFELIPDMLCVASTDGWFLRLNRAWEEILGFTRDELRSRPVFEFVHPDDTAPTLHELEKQAAGEHTFNFTNRYRTRDGSYRWLEWWATPAVDGQVYAAARDITERRNQDERIENLVAERELIVKEAHHRIKNDLSVVRSLLSLQAAQSSNEVVRESLSVASTRVGIMTSIYEQLYRRSNLQSVDAATFIRGIVADAQAAIALEGLEVELNVESRELSGRLAVAVGIVVNELITNAAKHAFAGVDRPRITIEGRTGDDDRFDLAVADNGAGFPDEILSGGRSGFGMTIVEALVEQHDGSVSLENWDGATVYISLPLGDSSD